MSYDTLPAEGHVGHEPKPSRRRCYCIAAIITVLVAGGVAAGVILARKSSSDSPSELWENIRLPDYIRPHHYDLEVQPNLETFDFKGKTGITVSVAKATKTLLLHILNMEIKSVSVAPLDSLSSPLGALEVDKFWEYKPHEYLVVQMKHELQPGDYLLSIEFGGVLGTSTVGFYRSSYLTPGGETRWLATTKFEPTHARRAFPCFDEPGMKANFTVAVVFDRDFYGPNSMEAVSNMPEVSTTPVEGTNLVRTVFQPSVLMSTYLVAFQVTDFTYKAETTESKYSPIEIRVFGSPHKVSSGHLDFALDTAVKVLSFYEEYFDIAYPLPKLDLVAIPDFQSGAMEDFGRITFRETNLLVDPLESSEDMKRRVVHVICHEISHMWFGNLVTMSWWDGLWLNEGFARYMEKIGAEAALGQDWLFRDQLLFVDLQSALTLDATDASHPILQPVNDPGQINELFDSISYDKGANVIRMMDNFLKALAPEGAGDIFISGVRNYLRAHLYDNAATSDLWDATTDAAKKAGLDLDIAAVMDTWTLQMGFPVIDLTPAGDGSATLMAAGQHARFYPFPTHEDPHQYGWRVPLKVRYAKAGGGHAEHFAWMNEDGKAIELNLADRDTSENGWVKLNADTASYFRVNYWPKMWQQLAAALQRGDAGLSTHDRLGLLSDAFALGDATELDYKTVLDVSRFLTIEKEYPVWATASRAMARAESLLRSQPDYGLWASYQRSRIAPTLATLGYDDVGDHATKLLRSLLINWSCLRGDVQCREWAQGEFAALMADPDNYVISPNLKGPIYNTAIKYGGQAEWEFLWNRYVKFNTISAAEASRALTALSYARDTWLLNRLLAYSMDSTKIRKQDTVSVVQSVANSGPIGLQAAWSYIKTHWDEFYTEFGTNGQRSFGSMVGNVVSGFTTEADYTEITSFLATRSVGPNLKTVKDGLTAIKRNEQWLLSNYNNVVEWLKNLDA